ncbi:MAG: hypothetical protein BAJATHORv1_90076 [Candidatus Thorarchaeota archaeon]|nr:MAG: hypothetical protein BAJATHORv1_90076 [Candidatus Thorarchaeota archaeon]
MKLLNRVALDPAQRKSSLSKQLGVTRSAVNQIWTRLEERNNLSVRSMIDYGKIGLIPVMGLVSTHDEPQKLKELSGWFQNNPFVVSLNVSTVAASVESVLLFEAIFPVGPQLSKFKSYIETSKESESTSAFISPITHQDYTLNIGNFSGSQWDLADPFRLEAVISATKKFADVLPEDLPMAISPPVSGDVESAIIVGALENSYFATTNEVLTLFRKLKFPHPSGRTIRRRMKTLRKSIVQPYVDIDGLGLTQKVALVVKASPTSDIVKTLIAQSTSFPKTWVACGTSLTLIYLDLPPSVDWFAISTTLSILDSSGSIISPFIISDGLIRKGLEGVLPSLIHKNHT